MAAENADGLTRHPSQNSQMGSHIPDAEVPDRLGRYVEYLRTSYPQITEIWLMGSRCTGANVHEGSDWDLLAFADAGTLDSMRLDRRVREPRMDLLVVTDGDCFEQPWIEEG
jgi:hypothetical protein